VKKHPSLDAHEILPGLWQGGRPPMGDVLHRHGFGMLVLCAREIQEDAEHWPGLDVIHAPNDDESELPSRETLLQALTAARQAALRVASGQRVLVTCNMGINRSGLVTAVAVRHLTGWPGTKVIQHVSKARKARNGWPALSNAGFRLMLSRLV